MKTELSDIIRTKVIRYGHTPDPDDAYMFYGFATGRVTIGDFRIEHVLEDIQTLNEQALRNEIEVTAISAAVYPAIRDNYWVLPMGASVGRNYGPVVAKRAGDTPAGRRIAVPGLQTTAAMLLRLYAPDFEPTPLRFDEIPAALKRGEVDYGLLIHEAQITYADLGLEKVMDLGVEWSKDTALPIPLGLDVVRKDLGRPLALEIAQALKRSIEAANADRDKAVEYALRYGRGLAKDLTDRFVGMYVNDDTLEIGEEGERALNVLFDKAHAAGILNGRVTADVLRP